MASSIGNRSITPAGSKAVLATTPLGRIGTTICYDLRFPGLYRMLAQAGGNPHRAVTFTRVTGAAHWHALMRARAIENGCYIVAPAQTGRREWPGDLGAQPDYRPLGGVLADAGTPPGITIAEIDPGKVEKARRAVPSLEADQMFSLRKLAARGLIRPGPCRRWRDIFPDAVRAALRRKDRPATATVRKRITEIVDRLFRVTMGCTDAVRQPPDQ